MSIEEATNKLLIKRIEEVYLSPQEIIDWAVELLNNNYYSEITSTLAFADEYEDINFYTLFNELTRELIEVGLKFITPSEYIIPRVLSILYNIESGKQDSGAGFIVYEQYENWVSEIPQLNLLWRFDAPASFVFSKKEIKLVRVFFENWSEISVEDPYSLRVCDRCNRIWQAEKDLCPQCGNVNLLDLHSEEWTDIMLSKYSA